MSYLGPRAKSLREFPRQPLMLGLIFSCYFHILFTPRTLLNSHVEALCLWKDLCSWKNQRRKKVLGKKREKKGPKMKEKVPFYQEKKKKIPLWKRLVLAELHSGVQISNIKVAVKPKFAIHNVKNEVSFSLCKYQPWYKNIKHHLES